MSIACYLTQKQLANVDEVEREEKTELAGNVVDNVSQLESKLESSEEEEYFLDYINNAFDFFNSNDKDETNVNHLLEFPPYQSKSQESKPAEVKPDNSSGINYISPQQPVEFSNYEQSSGISMNNLNNISAHFNGIDILLAAADIMANNESRNRATIECSPLIHNIPNDPTRIIDHNYTHIMQHNIDLQIPQNENQENTSVSRRRLRLNSDPDYQPKQQLARRPRVSLPNNVPKSDEKITIGPNGTQINLNDFKNIKWHSASAATRKLLSLIFSIETLATHSLTGRPSPAFRGRERPMKLQLDPKIIADIVQLVVEKCGVTERDVRGAITTKCADTTKMLRNSRQSHNN